MQPASDLSFFLSFPERRIPVKVCWIDAHLDDVTHVFEFFNNLLVNNTSVIDILHMLVHLLKFPFFLCNFVIQYFFCWDGIRLPNNWAPIVFWNCFMSKINCVNRYRIVTNRNGVKNCESIIAWDGFLVKHLGSVMAREGFLGRSNRLRPCFESW